MIVIARDVTMSVTCVYSRISAFVYKLGGVFPVYALLLLVGVALAVTVLLTSSNHKPPAYHVVSVVCFRCS